MYIFLIESTEDNYVKSERSTVDASTSSYCTQHVKTTATIVTVSSNA